MGESDLICNNTSSKSVLDKLKIEQEQYHEGSFEWTDIQEKMNQIIAENYLQYVNR